MRKPDNLVPRGALGRDTLLKGGEEGKNHFLPKKETEDPKRLSLRER